MIAEKYVTLQKPIKEYNELNISFGYKKDGYNYFTGDKEDGGAYVYIKPIKRTNGITSCTILGRSAYECGFKVFALSMARNNTKKIQKFADSFTPEVLEEIREQYEQQNFKAIRTLISEITKEFAK